MALTSIKTDGDEIQIVNQLLLPHTEEWIRIESTDDAYEAIKSMKIRGAPAIASLASLSIASHLSRALQQKQTTDPSPPPPPFLDSLEALEAHLDPIFSHLLSSRPTAVNLGQAISRLRKVLESSRASTATTATVTTTTTAREVAGLLVKEGRQIADEDVGRNREMSRLGAEWIVAQVEKKRRAGGASNANANANADGLKLNVMTVCNTGSLATSVRVLLLSCPVHTNNFRFTLDASEDRDTGLRWALLLTSMKSASSTEHIIPRARRTTKVPGW